MRKRCVIVSLNGQKASQSLLSQMQFGVVGYTFFALLNFA